jgi:uncharacterized protein with von Willebrand factor type A (vWA) domain
MAAEMPEAGRLAVAFARVLRASGVDVGTGDAAAFGRALGLVGLASRAGAYWSGRATLLRRREDVAAYDAAFSAFFDGRTKLHAVEGDPAEVIVAHDADTAPATDTDEAADRPPAAGTPVVTVRWSRAEVLRRRDFASLSTAEFDEARRLMADIRFAGARRRARRRRPLAHGRGRPDLRRTVRAALRYHGEPVRRLSTAPSTRIRRVVVLCDVSGSMEPYTRAVLRFVQAAVVGRGAVEAFTLGTRLTRVTAALSSRDPDAALAAVAQDVPDLAGGTRLGEGIAAFNDRWGIRGMARGAVVVVVSDGWDRGDPDLLTEQMARLHRVAHRVVWVNPLKAGEGYAPLARGMAAALPWVDDFVEGHSLASLEDLAAVIAR